LLEIVWIIFGFRYYGDLFAKVLFDTIPTELIVFLCSDMLIHEF